MEYNIASFTDRHRCFARRHLHDPIDAYPPDSIVSSLSRDEGRANLTDGKLILPARGSGEETAQVLERHHMGQRPAGRDSKKQASWVWVSLDRAKEHGWHPGIDTVSYGRLQAQTLFPRLLTRLPGLRIAGPLRYRSPGTMLRGIEHLPVTLTP